MIMPKKSLKEMVKDLKPFGEKTVEHTADSLLEAFEKAVTTSIKVNDCITYEEEHITAWRINLDLDVLEQNHLTTKIEYARVRILSSFGEEVLKQLATRFGAIYLGKISTNYSTLSFYIGLAE